MNKIKIAILDPFMCISDNNEEEIISHLSLLFGEAEGERIKGISNKNSKISSMGGLIALSFLAQDKCLPIFRDANGKPHFNDAVSTSFSISHSGRLSVAAYSGDSVGVDIEKINANRDLSKIAQRFFTQNELKDFMTAQSVDSFYEIWTRKEAYVKYRGETFGRLCTNDPKNVTFKTLLVEQGSDKYILSVCSDKEIQTEIMVIDDNLVIKEGEENVPFIRINKGL
jgi:phosphopantetheine--protein transferase-like protein